MQERACSLLVQFMNALVFLVDYGTIKISKDVADTIMKLLQNGKYICICLLLHEILIIDTGSCNQCVTTVSLKIKKLYVTYQSQN